MPILSIPAGIPMSRKVLQGGVALCVPGSSAPALTAPLYRLLGRRAPGVRLQLTTAMSIEARRLVEGRRVDMALMPAIADAPHIVSLPVYEEAFCLFGHRSMMGDATEPIAFSDIGDRPLVAPDPEHDLRKMIDRVAHDNGRALNVRYELNSAELLRRVVSEGVACAIMPRNAFVSVEMPGMMMREIVSPTVERVQALAWMADQPLTPACEAARDALLDVIRELVGSGQFVARLRIP